MIIFKELKKSGKDHVEIMGNLLQQMTKKQLIARIEELERLQERFQQEKEEETRLEFAWSGNLGHWYWDYVTNHVTFNPLKIQALGYASEALNGAIGYHFFVEKLHPDDYDRVMDNMRDHLSGKTSVYEVEYRIQTKNGSYLWFYDRGKVTKRDEKGKPLFLAGIVFDISERKKLERDLERQNKILSEQSSRDSLTSLYNHRAIHENLRVMLQNTKRVDPLSIMMIDLDNFKKINDTQGHIFGDCVLVETAKIILAHARKDDISGRYGGEEFLVIMPNTPLEEALKRAESIRKAIEKHYEHADFDLTISCGIKTYEGETIADFIHAADVNLYQAKREGKNRVIANV